MFLLVAVRKEFIGVRASLGDTLFLAHTIYYQNANIAIGVLNFYVVTFTNYPFSVITDNCSC
jgi:hypothetical protein